MASETKEMDGGASSGLLRCEQCLNVFNVKDEEMKDGECPVCVGKCVPIDESEVTKKQFPLLRSGTMKMRKDIRARLHKLFTTIDVDYSGRISSDEALNFAVLLGSKNTRMATRQGKIELRLTH